MICEDASICSKKDVKEKSDEKKEEEKEEKKQEEIDEGKSESAELCLEYCKDTFADEDKRKECEDNLCSTFKAEA